MYENGIFVVKSAGNTPGGADCTVTIPGSSLDSFTVVGGHFGDIGDVRRTNLLSELKRVVLDERNSEDGSAFGGYNGRDIIDITAPASRQKMVSGIGSNGYLTWTSTPWGTSYSAPTVTAHWYDKRHDNSGTELDDIDLSVRITSSATGNLLAARQSISAKNNKEMVFFPMSTIHENATISIRLRGYDVSSDNSDAVVIQTKFISHGSMSIAREMIQMVQVLKSKSNRRFYENIFDS